MHQSLLEDVRRAAHTVAYWEVHVARAKKQKLPILETFQANCQKARLELQAAQNAAYANECPKEEVNAVIRAAHAAGVKAAAENPASMVG